MVYDFLHLAILALVVTGNRSLSVGEIKCEGYLKTTIRWWWRWYWSWWVYHLLSGNLTCNRHRKYYRV